MRALVIGASGQLGKRLVAAGVARKIPVVGTARSRVAGELQALDIRDRAAVEKIISAIGPTVVFLCSALTAVDYCEAHPDEARNINVDGVRHVAEACAKIGAGLVFLSTDYVFEGNQRPYSEQDATGPVNVYGKTKVEAEDIVLKMPNSIVARTAVIYDWDPASLNFAMQMIKRLSEAKPTNVVSDQWNHPTLARNLADVLWQLVEKKARGLFHVVGPDYVSRFDFTLQLAEIFGLNRSLLSAIPTVHLKQPAPRPLCLNLKTDKVQRLIGQSLIGIRSGLELVHQDYTRT